MRRIQEEESGMLMAAEEIYDKMRQAYHRQAFGKDLARGSQAQASYLSLPTPYQRFGKGEISTE